MAGVKAFDFEHREVDVGEGDCEWGTHSSTFKLQPSTVTEGYEVIAEHEVSEGEYEVDGVRGEEGE
jgi:hypothetical protein